MNINDYYVALSMGCKKHNIPSTIINEIFKYEVESIRKKINVDFLESKLTAYQKLVMERRKVNKSVPMNLREKNVHLSLAEEFVFHINEYPYSNIEIEETACIIEKLVAKHKIDLKFAFYCCFPNKDEPATGVRFINYNRFYTTLYGSVSGVESIT